MSKGVSQNHLNVKKVIIVLQTQFSHTQLYANSLDCEHLEYLQVLRRYFKITKVGVAPGGRTILIEEKNGWMTDY